MASGGRAALARAGLVMVVAIAADQITKALVRGSIEFGQTEALIPGVDLVRVANDGIAFGLFEGLSTGILVAIAALFTLGLAFFLLTETEERPGIWLPIGLLAGGAVGNLIDRLREGYVTDFIDLPAWPAFNLADIEITVGVILLAVALLREPAAEQADPGAPDAPGGDSGDGAAEPAGR